MSHRIAEMMVRSQHDPGLFTGFQHITCIRHAERQRLLTKYVLSCPGSRRDLSFVPLVCGTDIDNVDAGIRQ